MLLKLLFLVLVLSAICTESARILGIFPMAGISHYILNSKLMRGLVEAGHDVTMVSPYLMKDPPKNGIYTDVLLDGVAEGFQRLLKDFNLFETDMNEGPIQHAQKLNDIFLATTNGTLHHPKMKQLTESNQKFDVVIMEQFINDAYKVYAHIFDCPLIILSSVGPSSWVNSMVGNPQPASYIPHMLFKPFSKNLSFIERTKNLFYYALDYLMNTYYILPKHDEIARALYPDSPSIYDLYTNVSLILLNSHTSINPASPLVPNMVEIGGYFIDPPKKLPQDLQEYLDNASDGVIYFSMGSNLKSKDLPVEKKQAILNVFGKLKQKVIWKFEEDLPGKPSNVLIRKWCPQPDILAHPNTRLFITHGGLLSTTETIYHGVPILAIPVFGDQPTNAERAVADGYALKLAYQDPDFSEKKIGSLIDELLTNPKYRQTVKEKSKLYHDRPMKPMETAVYWVEYVIRHQGAPHLRVAGVRLPWYQYFMVDVIGSIAFVLVLGLYLIKLFITRLMIRSSSSKKISKKHKNL